MGQGVGGYVAEQLETEDAHRWHAAAIDDDRFRCLIFPACLVAKVGKEISILDDSAMQKVEGDMGLDNKDRGIHSVFGKGCALHLGKAGAFRSKERSHIGRDGFGKEG